jgi:hypothetical protein
MTLNADETIAKSAGDLFLAPYPTAAPTDDALEVDATLEAAGYVLAGWLAEDGPKPDAFEGDTTKHKGWNRVAPIRSVTRVSEPTIQVPLLQWNATTLGLYFPSATYVEAERVLRIPETGTPTPVTLLLRIVDGDRYFGIWVAKCTPRPGGEFEFPGDGLAPIPVTFDILSTGDDDNYIHIIGVDPAEESS